MLSPTDIEISLNEKLVHRELQKIIDSLNANGVRHLFYKGTALAYTVYSSPESRPRLDSDILISPKDRARAGTVLMDLGYLPEPSSAENSLSYQRAYVKVSRWVRVVIDLHWKISNRPAFQNMISFEEAWPLSVAAPRLSPSARVFHPVHALLVATAHPYMHHHGEQDPIWDEDLRLLSHCMSDRDWDNLFELAHTKGVLQILQLHFPDRCPQPLKEIYPEEPSWDFVSNIHSTLGEALLDFKHSTTWKQKLMILRGHLLPNPEYMIDKYKIPRSRLFLLPLYYINRWIFGFKRISRTNPLETKS